ncbi:hypothetical protein ACQPVP_15500 [Clostridium nigeriense]|uniref:hypothetical protein n=1 Tax=Clostridium nigeriense TaxID=1805470 RepID=UPI003D342A39
MKKVILSIISVTILVIVLVIFKLINLRSEFEKYISSVSGGSKIPTVEKDTYDAIYLKN